MGTFPHNFGGEKGGDAYVGAWRREGAWVTVKLGVNLFHDTKNKRACV